MEQALEQERVPAWEKELEPAVAQEQGQFPEQVKVLEQALEQALKQEQVC